MKGFVYLILQADNHGEETYKIGITKNDPQIRLRQLKTGNPNSLSVLKSYQSEHYLKIERWLHRKYFSCKTIAQNEWRTLTDEQVASFIDDCKHADDNFTWLSKRNPFF